jgi:uncharacterized membrane protein YjgN (DUF898 family)
MSGAGTERFSARAEVNGQGRRLAARLAQPAVAGARPVLVAKSPAPHHTHLKQFPLRQVQSGEVLMETAAVATHPISFKGSAGEYFKIWIVNLMLTIVTLGIYSAWAKVRTRKYFLGNTRLAGHSFDYHGDPVRILKGRIIVGALVLGYSVGGKIHPVIALVCGGILALAFPWLLVRGMIFNLKNTSYRNVRFGFEKAYSESYKTYIKAGLATVFTLGLMAPWGMYLHILYRISHSRFGTARFRLEEKSSEITKPWYRAMGVYVLGVVCIALLSGFAMVAIQGANKGADKAVIMAKYATMMFVLSILIGGPVFMVAVAIIKARVPNAVARLTSLKDVRFSCQLRARDMWFIYVTNALAILFSLGLAVPWAMIRLAKYRAERTQVLAPPESLNLFAGDPAALAAQGAVADAAIDFWDIDLGF